MCRALQTDRYVPIGIFVHKEVELLFDKIITKHDGIYIITDYTSLGKMIMGCLEGKRAKIQPWRLNNSIYTEEITIGIHEKKAIDLGVNVSKYKMQEINLFCRNYLREMLYLNLAFNLEADPNYHIKNAVQAWMNVMGIGEDLISSESLLRNFRNWRKCNAPELMRPKGKPTRKDDSPNNSVYKLAS